MIEVSGYALAFLVFAVCVSMIAVLIIERQFTRMKNTAQTFHNTLERVCDGEWELYRDDKGHVKAKVAEQSAPMGFHRN